MKNLVYKELTLSIHKFFYLLPFLLAALLFIPNWIFLLVFMYFFWISVPQIFSAYLANGDYNFNSMLPVTRKDVVTSKIVAFLLLEGLHLVTAVIFGSIHVLIYGQFNLFMDLNLAFFGVGILLFGVFNIAFLPAYFKTAYFFGMPTIYGVIATLIYGFIFEYGAIRFQFMRDIFEGNLLTQTIAFLVTAALGVLLTFLALKQSQINYENIDS